MKYSTRAALIIYVLLPLLGILCVVAYLGLSLLERHFEARMQEDVELIARTLQEPVSRGVEEQRTRSVERALRPAFAIHRVYSANVYGPDGEIIASTGVVEDDADEADRMREIAEDGDQMGEYSTLAGRSVYSHFVPLTDRGGRIMALLQVTRRKSDFDRELNTLRWRALWLLVLCGAGLSAVVLWGHRAALGRPMHALTQDMARVEQGFLEHRATPDGPAEVRRLAVSLNQMLDSLRRAEDELSERRARQRELERQLQQAEKMAALGRLAGGVAHELGTPLSLIEGKARRALRDPGARESHLQAIRREVRRLESIVTQLLDFARGRREVRIQPVSVAQLIEGAIDAVRDEIDAREITLDWRQGPDQLAMETDPVRMQTALVNLIRNAVQAVSRGGRIRVGTLPQDSRVEIRVEDDGPGIPDDLRSKVLEPFFTTRPVGEGTGLGLAVAHGVAEEQGGALRIEDTPLGGACFVLDLPLSAEEPPT